MVEYITTLYVVYMIWKKLAGQRPYPSSSLVSGSVLPTDVTVAHDNTSPASGSSITEDWGHWKEKLGAPYILQNQTKTVFATLGHTTYLHCFVGNIGDRQVGWLLTPLSMTSSLHGVAEWKWTKEKKNQNELSWQQLPLFLQLFLFPFLTYTLLFSMLLRVKNQ